MIYTPTRFDIFTSSSRSLHLRALHTRPAQEEHPTMGLYMQPQIHNDCMRDCNIGRSYCIVKRQNIFNILIIL